MQDLDLLESDGFEVTTETLQINTIKETIEHNLPKSIIPQRRWSDWTLSLSMATPIKDITDLVKEYKWEEKYLNSFIKNIDKLWTHIANHENNDKARFLLVLQLKLVEKAAEATKNVEFNDWATVKKALIDNIKPQKNIEKAELKLTTVKRLPKEERETYAKRVEELLDDLNKCFELEDGYEVMKKENARKARKAFENGLQSSSLKNKAIARGCNNLMEVVDYVIEQELRTSEFKPQTNEKFCYHCKMKYHSTFECKRKPNNK